MLTRQSIAARLGIAFASLVLLLVVALGVGLYGLAALEDSTHDLRHNAGLTHNAAQVRRLALELRRFEKDSFINLAARDKVADYRRRWDSTRQSLAATLEQGAALAGDSALREQYRDARRALDGYASGFAAVAQRIADGELDGAAAANAAMGRYKDEVYRLDASAAAIDASALAQLEAAEQRAGVQARNARLGLLGFAVLAVLAAAVLALRITRSITAPLRDALEATRRLAEGDLTHAPQSRRQDETGRLLAAMGSANHKLGALVGSLHHSSDNVLQRAHEVLIGSQELAARTEEQVAALQQTAASMEQVSASAQQTSEATAQANSLAATAARTAQSGGRDVEENIQLMRALADSSQRINDIIRVIDGIAFQTNILALNASVEAARAGEQGRGFAVVAGEVRSLASRSAQASQEIRALINASVERVDAGSKLVAQAGSSMQEIVDSVQKVADIMDEIAAASQEQSSGIALVNQAVTQMDVVTQQNANLVQEASRSAADLVGEANRLRQAVEGFRVLAEFEQATGRSPAAAAKSWAQTQFESAERSVARQPTTPARKESSRRETDDDWQDF